MQASGFTITVHGISKICLNYEWYFKITQAPTYATPPAESWGPHPLHCSRRQNSCQRKPNLMRNVFPLSAGFARSIAALLARRRRTGTICRRFCC